MCLSIVVDLEMLFHERSVLLLLSRIGPGCMVQQGVADGTSQMSCIGSGHICGLRDFAHHDHVDLHFEKSNFGVCVPR